MSFADDRCIRPNPSLNTTLSSRNNPIDVFLRLATAENYDYEATEQIQIFLVFEGRTPGGRSNDICRLMSLINERLKAGHFDYWEKNQALVYRNAVSLRGGATLKTEQAMDMLAHALDAAERGYPACQFIIWLVIIWDN